MLEYTKLCMAVTMAIGIYAMAELTVYNKTLEWEIFRVSSAKWGKLSRLHTDFFARALITRISNRQGHVQSQTGCRLLVIASM